MNKGFDSGLSGFNRDDYEGTRGVDFDSGLSGFKDDYEDNVDGEFPGKPYKVQK